jgi:predicted hotdog family 3-hydroxylacyl-ACP dehydratase
VSWDPDGLQCTATSHRDPRNPLRNGRGLPAVSGVEYAAQAMAVHASLVNGDAAPRPGYLAGLRNLVLQRDWLHQLDSDLAIGVSRRGGDERGAIYDFRLEGDGRPVLHGRAIVMFADTQEQA